MQEIETLIETLQTLRVAIRDQEQEHALSAITVYLVQFMDIFGSTEVFQKYFPVLEELREDIKAENYEDAMGTTLALLVQMRQIKQYMEESYQSDDEDI